MVNNALKYAHRHTNVMVKCELNPEGRSIKEGNVYRLSVTSYGEPIPEIEQKDIFRMGYRSEVAQQTGESGMGVGLPIVKGLAELHGGVSGVISTPISEYHIAYLRMYNLDARKEKYSFSEEEAKSFLEADKRMWLSKFPEDYKNAMYRGKGKNIERYVKGQIHTPTASNEFFVEFPQPEGGK